MISRVATRPHAAHIVGVAFFSGRDDWKGLIERHPTDAVLASSAALPPLVAVPGWQRVHADAVATILVREGSPMANLPPLAEAPPAGVFP